MTDNSDHREWDMEITASSSLLDLKLRDVWQYRDLLYLLVRRDVVSFYKQTVLGPVWFFAQPIITIIFYSFIGNLAGISTGGVPRPLFYLAGTIIWNYFADCLTKTSTVFKDNSGLLGKVYFPRLIMPLSLIASNLIRFTVQLILFVILLVFYSFKSGHITLNIYALMFPILVLIIAAQGLGIGMLISSVTTKYRDLAFVVSFGVPLLVYTTTILFPLSEVYTKYPAYSWVVEYNPVTAIIEFFRYGFLGEGTNDWWLLAYSVAFTLVVAFAGIIVFNRVERNFVDTV
ncbi:ABC transporter permease [Mucilaginibacter myungsuensis]|uniref:Transport permease protein n=1 Tax=Mucilaginibacter myungsuensis TaxID=649104 RepID=A0A929KSP6_9SPHI|nr:ABC transporter permease [Mucilaginibacter myungsuensis]MBE9660819.1 ABC transporter permease [Mucilaginibacter myungsuensis]MDN3600865.1 ABC transporter permease [Mucilaginibacter myungsuensis]